MTVPGKADGVAHQHDGFTRSHTMTPGSPAQAAALASGIGPWATVTAESAGSGGSRLGNIKGILGPAGTRGPTRGHATDDRLLAVEVDEPLKGQGVSGHVPGQVLDRLRVVPGPRGTCLLLRTRTVRPEKRKCPLVPFYRALRNNLSR
jgi:hypothetical protein